MVLPMEEMKQWFENRPPGFGQGKNYDTAVEDKLLDEIRQSRVAQLANINRLKHNPIPPGGVSKVAVKGGVSKEPTKAPEVAPSGVRVHLLNLPKKKNIHRDLQIAFKEVLGIVSISPAVSGTKTTRDPICKGYGFVYFKSEGHAKRFVQVFSTKSIAFGKIQKQIKCELANPSSDDTSFGIPVPNTLGKSSLPVLSHEDDLTTFIWWSRSSSEPSEEAESDESPNSDDDDLIAGEYSNDSYEPGNDIISGEYSDESDESGGDLIMDEFEQIPDHKTFKQYGKIPTSLFSRQTFLQQQTRDQATTKEKGNCHHSQSSETRICQQAQIEGQEHADRRLLQIWRELHIGNVNKQKQQHRMNNDRCAAIVFSYSHILPKCSGCTEKPEFHREILQYQK